MNNIRIRHFWLLLAFALSAQAGAAAEINTLEKRFFKYTESSVAIRGYDTVAYFKLGKAVKGKSAYQSSWKGAIWHFSTASHLALFRQSPDRYAPRYGGYCAFGITEGYLARIEGDQWAIVDGKLYLSYNKQFKNRWLDKIDENIWLADAQFPTLIQ